MEWERIGKVDLYIQHRDHNSEHETTTNYEKYVFFSHSVDDLVSSINGIIQLTYG